MTARNTAEKGDKLTEALKTARLFAFQVKGRRLPTPRWKENGGEVRFASDRPDIPRQRPKKTDRAPAWAFDFAWPDYLIAVEVEGIDVRTDRVSGRRVSTGGHTDPAGFTDDCEKYAWAAVLGWRLLRFTPAQVRSGFAVDMVVRMFAVVDQPQRVEVVRLAFDRDSGNSVLAPGQRLEVVEDREPVTNELGFAPAPGER